MNKVGIITPEIYHLTNVSQTNPGKTDKKSNSVFNLKRALKEASSSHDEHMAWERELWRANAFIIPLVVYPILSILGHIWIEASHHAYPSIDSIQKELEFYRKTIDSKPSPRPRPKILVLDPDKVRTYIERIKYATPSNAAIMNSYDNYNGKRNLDEYKTYCKGIRYNALKNALENALDKGMKIQY